MTNTVTRLRRSIIKKRNSLPSHEQRNYSKMIAQHLCHQLIFLRAQRIAFYFSNKGEVETQIILNEALKMSKECFFPILHPVKHNCLWFGRYHKGDVLKKNVYGIPEPDLHYVDQVTPWSIDLVITPLVAFDQQGNRVGMGGGYYDRTFAFKKRQSRSKPFLLGLAYDFQQIPIFEARSWDVPLDAILTETRFLPFYKSLTTPR